MPVLAFSRKLLDVLGYPVQFLLKENVQTKNILVKLFNVQLSKNKYEIKKKEYDFYKLKNDFKDYLKSFFNNQKRISIYSD